MTQINIPLTATQNPDGTTTLTWPAGSQTVPAYVSPPIPPIPTGKAVDAFTKSIKDLLTAGSSKISRVWDNSVGSYVPNPALWCKTIPRYSAVFTKNANPLDGRGSDGNGCLLSPTSMINIIHQQEFVGETVTIFDAAGVPHTRRILREKQVVIYPATASSKADGFVVSAWDDPINAAGILYPRRFQKDWAKYLPASGWPIFLLDQGGCWIVQWLSALNSVVYGVTPTTQPYNMHVQDPAAKLISGSPQLAWDGVDLVLLGTVRLGSSTSLTSPSLAYYADLVDEALVSLGEPTIPMTNFASRYSTL